jgi:hypothetical protein
MPDSFHVRHLFSIKKPILSYDIGEIGIGEILAELQVGCGQLLQ